MDKRSIIGFNVFVGDMSIAYVRTKSCPASGNKCVLEYWRKSARSSSNKPEARILSILLPCDLAVPQNFTSKTECWDNRRHFCQKIDLLVCAKFYKLNGIQILFSSTVWSSRRRRMARKIHTFSLSVFEEHGHWWFPLSTILTRAWFTAVF